MVADEDVSRKQAKQRDRCLRAFSAQYIWDNIAKRRIKLAHELRNAVTDLQSFEAMVNNIQKEISVRPIKLCEIVVQRGNKDWILGVEK